MAHFSNSNILSNRGKDCSFLSTVPTSGATNSRYQDNDGSANNSTEKVFVEKVQASRLALCVRTGLGLIIISLELKGVNASRLGTASAPL